MSEETEEHRSPLADWHEAQGAEVLIEDGYPWYMHEGGDPLEEYEAVRTSVGIWDLFSTCKYEVTGPDAARLVQRRFTNALEGMQDGSARYGAFVNADGKMIDDGNVYRFSADRYWMMINSAGIQDWFRETAEGLDARIEHRTDDFCMISVQGPKSQEALQRLVDRDLSELRYFRFWPDQVKVAGVDAWVLRTGFSGEKGYEVVMEPADARPVWDALLAAGAKPFGLTAIDLARTEVGLIIIAVDYNPGETSPWDLSMDKFIKTDTECVAAAALAERGANPPKRFKTLKIESEAAPDYGATVTKDGREVGILTSPAVSPRVGTIGLAILDSDVATEGEKVEVAVGDGTAPATVEPLAILDPTKERPAAGAYAPAVGPPLVAVVPNFSEGRRPDVIEAICRALEVPGARLVYRQADPDHHRLDTTVLGSPDAVRGSAMAAARIAVSLIDMDQHKGGHPRMGSVDVVPFVPLRGISMEEVVVIARGFAVSMAEELSVPVYLYGEAATSPERASLAEVRRGEYEGLREAVARGERLPDFGPHAIGKAGATAVGARKPLIAFNVYLAGEDGEVAAAIARAVRESSGGLPALRAIGFVAEERGLATVSMNLVDHEVTGVRQAFDAVESEARRRGIDVIDSEIVGLAPEAALGPGDVERVRLAGFDSEVQVLEALMDEPEGRGEA